MPSIVRSSARVTAVRYFHLLMVMPNCTHATMRTVCP